MASVTRAAPATFGTDVNFLGKTLVHLDIDWGVDAVGPPSKLGPASAVAAIMDRIQGAGFNIVIIGPLHSTNNNVSICVEGDFGTDTYDGTNSETLAVHLEDVVQAGGTVDGVNLATVTVTAKTYVL